MNVLNDQMKLEAKNAMKDIFDTFKRSKPLRFYKTQKEEVVFFDPNYNADFMEMNQASSVLSTSTYKDFSVRVWYLDLQEYSPFIQGGNDLNIKAGQAYNRIKIQMEADAYEYLKGTEKFEFDSEKYAMQSSWRRIGIFDEFQFYEITLIRLL
jgi:hypothetical protein